MRKDAGGYGIRNRRTIGMYTAERSWGEGGALWWLLQCVKCVLCVSVCEGSVVWMTVHSCSPIPAACSRVRVRSRASSTVRRGVVAGAAMVVLVPGSGGVAAGAPLTVC